MAVIRTRSTGGRLIAAMAATIFATGVYTGAAQAACQGGGKVLGVSRTITLDTQGGKLYGGLQYGSSDLLRDGEVVLTFDDGPLRRYTRMVLEALEAHCTKGTFFMVGRMAVSDPAMVREVEAAGHTIASHTWSHPNLGRRSARKAGGEIELGISAVQKAATKPIAPFFRFPYLADPNAMIAYAKERDLGVFSIDIDSYDYRTRKAEKVYSTIMRQLRDRRKGIMLFHDIQVSTAHAMKRLLDTLHREGFKVVHIEAKAPVRTIKSFDETAAELHEKRRTQVAAAPIGGGAYEDATTSRPPVRAPAKASTPQTRVVLNSEKTQPTATFNPTTTQPAPVRPKQPEKDWRRAIWGN
jgi:peptidoglycan/xylan/chitin deacetylase (PgdA/CDA1 family)